MDRKEASLLSCFDKIFKISRISIQRDKIMNKISNEKKLEMWIGWGFGMSDKLW